MQASDLRPLIRDLERDIQAVNAKLQDATQALTASGRRKAVASAAKLACDALERLFRQGGLWTELRGRARRPRQREIAELDRVLCDQAVIKLLQALGYSDAHAHELIKAMSRALDRLGGRASKTNPALLITDAERNLAAVRDGVCTAKDSAVRLAWLLSARDVLAGVLLAAVVIPGVQDVVGEISPSVAAALQELYERVGDVLVSLSAVVAATPFGLFSDRNSIYRLQSQQPARQPPDHGDESTGVVAGPRFQSGQPDHGDESTGVVAGPRFQSGQPDHGDEQPRDERSGPALVDPPW